MRADLEGRYPGQSSIPLRCKGKSRQHGQGHIYKPSFSQRKKFRTFRAPLGPWKLFRTTKLVFTFCVTEGIQFWSNKMCQTLQFRTKHVDFSA